jgi:hypothetical protein
VQADDPQAVVELVIVNEDTGQGEQVNIPGGSLFYAMMRMDFDPGTYRWTLSLNTETQQDLCAQGGTFLMQSEPTPSFLDLAATLAARILSPATPETIIVTATPPPESTPETAP